MFTNSTNLDDEWEQFLTGNNENTSKPTQSHSKINKNKHRAKVNLDIDNDTDTDIDIDIDDIDNDIECGVDFDNKVMSANIYSEICPKPSPIYISTKTNISYLTTCIDLKTVFWKIPVLPYSTPTQGVIKKQMKFNSLLPEELEEIQANIADEPYVEENVIMSIDNPTGRIKFKDIRKVSIGISKKDLTSYRSKKKSAFYNCFVLILRIHLGGLFREFHVKVFNTGKIEIPGIQSDQAFHTILKYLLEILQPHMNEKIGYRENSTETVLINSNFHCGFFINQDALFHILKNKYNVQCIYDRCSYPGIQCKYTTEIQLQAPSQSNVQEDNNEMHKNTNTNDKNKDKKNTIKNKMNISFMIFRTGSVLIVGKCDESILNVIYTYLNNIFQKEFHSIAIKLHSDEELKTKEKKVKTRRKIITNII